MLLVLLLFKNGLESREEGGTGDKGGVKAKRRRDKWDVKIDIDKIE